MEHSTSSTGLSTITKVEDGKLKIHYSQDISGALEYTKALRDAPEYSKQGIKQNLQHAAHVSEVIAMKMLHDDGFDVYAATAKELRDFLTKNRSKYARCFVTAGQI